MEFKVGDRVIYPHHGAATITSKETRTAFGEEREYLVLKTAHGELTLSVPADMAEAIFEVHKSEQRTAIRRMRRAARGD